MMTPTTTTTTTTKMQIMKIMQWKQKGLSNSSTAEHALQISSWTHFKIGKVGGERWGQIMSPPPCPWLFLWYSFILWQYFMKSLVKKNGCMHWGRKEGGTDVFLRVINSSRAAPTDKTETNRLTNPRRPFHWHGFRQIWKYALTMVDHTHSRQYNSWLHDEPKWC